MGFVVGEVATTPLTPTPPGSIGVGSSPGAPAELRTEAGVGAMASWAGYLWFTTYPDETGKSVGNGLWRVGPNWVPELVDSNEGCHAGRQIFGDDLYIGEHKISNTGAVTRITGFVTGARGDRITAWARVPAVTTHMYALTMGGLVYRVPVDGTVATLVVDAKAALNISGQAHFKAAWGIKNRLYICTNRNIPDGRFGYMTAGTNAVTRLDNANGTGDSAGCSFVEVAGSYDGDGHAFAFGQNDNTGFMYVLDGTSTNHAHRRFLMPIQSQQQAFAWQQEWMRLRMIDTERFALSFHGTWYQVSPFLQAQPGLPSEGAPIASSFPRIEPVARYIRTVTDYTIHNGKVVLGSNSSSTQYTNRYPNTGSSQSSIVVLDSTDDLLRAGIKATGSGYFFQGATLTAGATSDPMLARGYDKKCVQAKNAGGSAVTLEILAYHSGGGEGFVVDTLTVPAGGYAYKVLPDGYGADWLAVRSPAAAGPLSAWVVYS